MSTNSLKSRRIRKRAASRCVTHRHVHHVAILARADVGLEKKTAYHAPNDQRQHFVDSNNNRSLRCVCAVVANRVEWLRLLVLLLLLLFLEESLKEIRLERLLHHSSESNQLVRPNVRDVARRRKGVERGNLKEKGTGRGRMHRVRHSVRVR